MPCRLICWDFLEKLADNNRRKAHGGFVQHQDSRMGHQGSANGQHLLLAAGKAPAQLLFTFLQTGRKRKHLFQFGVVGFPAPEAVPVDGTDFQIIPDRQSGKDVASFRHVDDMSVSHFLG